MPVYCWLANRRHSVMLDVGRNGDVHETGTFISRFVLHRVNVAGTRHLLNAVE